jgi:hypothetical protein
LLRLFGLLLLVNSFCCGQPFATGTLIVTITDSSTNQPTPVRVRVATNGHSIRNLPKEAIAVMYGVWDHADGYGFQPDSSFYVDGSFEVDLPAGKYSIALSKGIEYVNGNYFVDVVSNTITRETCKLRRWIDMPARKWYSADDHIHIRRSPREDPLLMKWIQAEDVHVGVLLKMGDFWSTYFDQYAWGSNGVYNNGSYMLSSGQEDPRTPEVGHAIGIGAAAPVRYQSEYYYYDKVFDKLHQLGGITGYAHQAESFHGYRGLMLDGLRRKVDIMEILQFCVSEEPLLVRHYYHMLDLGYAITAVAGSDFPWCGNDHDIQRVERNARIGNVRFYTYVDKPFSIDTWKAAVKAGHTFVTNGPMLELTVNGKMPGDTLHVKRGESVVIDANAFGNIEEVPLKKLELVIHGEVVETKSSTAPTDRLSIETRLKVTKGFWVAVRAYGRSGQAAHTTPVYVSVDNQGFHNPATLSKYLDLANQYLDELEKELQEVNTNPERQAWRYRDGIEKRIKATREVIKEMREVK